MPAREFVLRNVFKNVADLKDGQQFYSEWEEHFKVNWRVCIKKGLLFYIHLQSDIKEGSGQSVRTEFKLRIISSTGEVSSKGEGKYLFTEKEPDWRFEEFTEWSNALNKYLIDGNLKVEVHVKVLKDIGIPREYLRSFGEDVKQFSDVALVVDDEKFYVSKLFLSTHSPYFATLFLGPFEESGKPEVQLKDIDPVDLQYFLEVLYGDPGVDEKTVSGVLEIANMYDTQIVVKKCEEFLLEKSDKSLKEKLQLAGEYRLESLKKACMEKIKTVADIRSVTPSEPEDMNHEILADLFKKLLNFH